MNYRRQGVLLVAFREKRSQRKPVLMLSTATAAGTVPVRPAAGRDKDKPKCVDLYNKYVDISDRKIYYVSAERPSKRYWKIIFFNMLDMALLNSFELYKANTDARQSKSRHDYVFCRGESLCRRGPRRGPRHASGATCSAPGRAPRTRTPARETGAGLRCLLGPRQRHPQAKLLLVPWMR